MPPGRASGSAFVDCPVCFCKVPFATINTHLDTACKLTEAPPRKKQRLIAAGESTDTTVPRLQTRSRLFEPTATFRARAPEVAEGAAEEIKAKFGNSSIERDVLADPILQRVKSVSDEVWMQPGSQLAGETFPCRRSGIMTASKAEASGDRARLTGQEADRSGPATFSAPEAGFGEPGSRGEPATLLQPETDRQEPGTFSMPERRCREPATQVGRGPEVGRGESAPLSEPQTGRGEPATVTPPQRGCGEPATLSGREGGRSEHGPETGRGEPATVSEPERGCGQPASLCNGPVKDQVPQCKGDGKPPGDKPLEVQWWTAQCQRHNQPAAFWRKNGSRSTVPLTSQQLQATVPVEVVQRALPSDLADTLMCTMLAESRSWARASWWIAGLHQKAAHTSCLFEFHPQEGAPGSAHAPSQQDQEDRADDNGSVPFMRRPAPEPLLAAARVIADVIKLRLLARRVDLAPDDREGWEPSYALSNLYKDGSESVGEHSDRLTTLGPRPIIASLSLGAERTFRLSRATGRSGEKVRDNSGVDVVDVPMPHNSLVIMWPPCQEEWRHEVPKSKSVKAHPVAGLTRVNITFRKMKEEWAVRAPNCHCGRQAVLKAKRGKYVYTCDNTKGATCSFWQPAPVSLR